MSEVIHSSLDTLVPFAKLRAKRGILRGQMTPEAQRLIRACMHYLRVDAGRVANILYTRDAGHNSSGWWKNPDYERCFHLSLSYSDMRGAGHIQHDKRKSEEIARAFYGDEINNVWCEPPYSPEGKSSETWHYRLFCDEGWQPMKPRGEVYSKDWTPAGWKSFSDLHGEVAA